jgi:hypothetical protein
MVRDWITWAFIMLQANSAGACRPHMHDIAAAKERSWKITAGAFLMSTHPTSHFYHNAWAPRPLETGIQRRSGVDAV